MSFFQVELSPVIPLFKFMNLYVVSFPLRSNPMIYKFKEEITCKAELKHGHPDSFLHLVVVD